MDNQTTTLHALTGKKVLVKNTVWNLIGQGAPMVVAIFAIPFLIKGLGTDRFGILTIAWIVIGYFSLFDMGIGRATTKFAADYLARGEYKALSSLFWTSTIMLSILGILGGLIAALLTPWLINHALNIPNNLKDESLKAFYLLALSIPLVLVTAGSRGFLEAQQRFALVNAIKIPATLTMYVAPLIILPFSINLFPVVAILSLSRLIIFITYFYFCLRSPNMSLTQWINIVRIKQLLSYGSWLTVSNIISPIMVYMDRFLIGALLTMNAVAYYTTPYEVVTKFWLFPGAITGVLFPAFSASFVYDTNRTRRLFVQGLKYVFLVMFPITLSVVMLAHEAMNIWLGSEFAKNSAIVLQWLSAGVFINSIGQVLFALVQGVGRPDLTAKLHLIELPFYLLAVVMLISMYGIEGAAIAWVVRVAIDTTLLYAMVRRLLPLSSMDNRRMLLCMSAALLTIMFSALLNDIVAKVIFLILTLSSFMLFSWFIMIKPELHTRIT